MIPYADANFFTRLYFELHGHEDSERLVSNLQGHLLPITWLHEIEIRNALELSVFHFANSGQTPRITREMAMVAQAQFTEDVHSEAFCCRKTLKIGDVASEVNELTLRYTANKGYRTYDLIHVAQAKLLGCDTFWSFDRKANQLAAAEGLEVVSG